MDTIITRILEHYRQDEAKHFEELNDMPDWYWEADFANPNDILRLLAYCREFSISHIYLELLKLKLWQVLGKK